MLWWSGGEWDRLETRSVSWGTQAACRHSPLPHSPLTDVCRTVEYPYHFRHFPNRTAFIYKANFYNEMQSPSESPYLITTSYSPAPNLKMAFLTRRGIVTTRRNNSTGQLIHRTFCSRFPNTVKGLAITNSFFFNGAFAELRNAIIIFAMSVRPYAWNNWTDFHEIWYWGVKREDQQDATIRCLLLTSVSSCFVNHYAHFRRSKALLHLLCCSGSAGCGW